MVNASTLIGVVLLARHGDRSSTVYQNYSTYNSVQGYLTPLGAVRLPAHDLFQYSVFTACTDPGV